MGESWRVSSRHPYGNGGNENFKAEDAHCVKNQRYRIIWSQRERWVAHRRGGVTSESGNEEGD